MKTLKNHIIIISVIILMVSGCLEPYQPPTIFLDEDILVVDGFLNSADGSAAVILSHASALSDENENEPEVNATVSIRTEDGNAYELTEQDPGTYTAAGLSIDPSKKYQLSVRTSQAQEYVSDFIEIEESPDIDSITWRATEDGVDILVNAHDATGNTQRYRWDYVETWEYHAPVSSDYKLVGLTPVYRTAEEGIYTCWRTLPSTKISIASTVRLADDVIHEYPLVFLTRESGKFSQLYSILVKQRSVSKEEFEFLEQLQKSTESIGGLFDPQPSQVIGNLHNLTNPSAPVLGYFSGGSTKELRFFLDYQDLPLHLKRIRPAGCQVDTVCVVPGVFMCEQTLGDLTGTELLGSALYSGPSIVAYTLTGPPCADCRIQGGVTTKPPFWP